jgi:hypothetical protein
MALARRMRMEIKTPTKEERIAFHLRGIKMSLVPALFGVAAGFLSSPYVLSVPHQSFSFLILALAIYAQKFVFPRWGIESGRFDAKAWFYVGFLTFSYWYISWAIIMNGMPHVDGVPAPQFGPFF